MVGVHLRSRYNTPRIGRVLIARAAMRPNVPFLAASFSASKRTDAAIEVITQALARRPVGSTLAPETAFIQQFDPMASIQWLQISRS